jgi:hypothetical protein
MEIQETKSTDLTYSTFVNLVKSNAKKLVPRNNTRNPQFVVENGTVKVRLRGNKNFESITDEKWSKSVSHLFSCSSAKLLVEILSGFENVKNDLDFDDIK